MKAFDPLLYVLPLGRPQIAAIWHSILGQAHLNQFLNLIKARGVVGGHRLGLGVGALLVLERRERTSAAGAIFDK